MLSQRAQKIPSKSMFQNKIFNAEKYIPPFLVLTKLKYMNCLLSKKVN